MSEFIDFNLGDNSVPQWATTKDFQGEKGRKISIIGFKRLSREKGETTAKFVDSEGMTYRLTFLDMEADNKKRYLEVHAKGFKNDLATSVRREFGMDSLPIGQVVLLRTYKEKRAVRGRDMEVNRWVLTKLDLPIPTPKEEVTDDKGVA